MINEEKEKLEIELLKQQTFFFTMLNEKIENNEGIPVTIVDTTMKRWHGYNGREGYNFKKGYTE